MSILGAILIWVFSLTGVITLAFLAFNFLFTQGNLKKLFQFKVEPEEISERQNILITKAITADVDKKKKIAKGKKKLPPKAAKKLPKEKKAGKAGKKKIGIMDVEL